MAVELSEDEKKATFRALWEMAKSDKRVGDCERSSLDGIHKQLFGTPMPLTAYPYPDHAETRDHIRRPPAKELLLTMAFDVLRADGEISPEERDHFRRMSGDLGLPEDQIDEAWTQRARAYMVRRAEGVVTVALDTLMDELIKLAEELGVGAICDAELQRLLERGVSQLGAGLARKRQEQSI